MLARFGLLASLLLGLAISGLAGIAFEEGIGVSTDQAADSGNTMTTGSVCFSSHNPMRLATGSYAGTGLDDRQITGVGFQPDAVIIRSSTARVGIVRTSTMNGDASKILGDTGALAADLIQSLDADGFTIGTDARVNNSGETYYWAAMKAGCDLAVGSYLGDGSDNRSIAVGFQPVWVVTLGDGNDSTFRPGPISGDASYDMTGTGKLTNRIQAMEANGFQIGSDVDVNKAGVTYHYIAWAASFRISTGSYSGDGTDNRSISGVGFQPLVTWIKRDDASQSVWRPASLAGDATLFMNATAASTNRIQALQSDGFQVGTAAQVNYSGATFYHLDLRDTGP